MPLMQAASLLRPKAIHQSAALNGLRRPARRSSPTADIGSPRLTPSLKLLRRILSDPDAKVIVVEHRERVESIAGE